MSAKNKPSIQGNEIDANKEVKLDQQLLNLDSAILRMQEKLTYLQAEEDASPKLIHAEQRAALKVQISSLRHLKDKIDATGNLTHQTKQALSIELSEMISFTEVDDHSEVTNDLGLLKMHIIKSINALEEGRWRSVRDLIGKNVKLDLYPDNATTEKIHDVLTEAFLNTKSTEWVDNFSEWGFRKKGLDISKDEFISEVFSQAYLNMNRNMLDALLGNTMHVTLNGKQEFFGTDPDFPKTYDESYDKIIRKGLEILDGDNQGNISHTKELEEINFVSHVAPKKKIITKVPSPRQKPEFTSPKKKIENIKGDPYQYSNKLNAVLISIQNQDVLTGASTLIIEIEGFEAYPYYDYKQWSWGNGTKVPDEVVKKIPKEVRETIVNNTNNGSATTISARRVKTVGKISKADAIKDKIAHLKSDYNILKKYDWFNQMTNMQKMSILSFSYNLGVGKLVSTGVGLAEALKSGKSNGKIADKIIQYVYANKKIKPGLLSRRQLEIEIFLAPELSENQRYATVHPKTGIGLGKVTSNLIKELTGDSIESGVIAVRMERIKKLSLQKWDGVVVSFVNNSYVVAVNGIQEFIIDKQGNVSKEKTTKLATNY